MSHVAIRTPETCPTPEPGASELYAKACGLWNAGKRSEAVAALDEALRRCPEFPEALCMGGFMLGELGRPQAALRFYARARELDPSLRLACVNSGKILFDLRRHAEALAAFEAATALAPGDADAWNCRAGALREIGRLEDLLQAANHALTLRSDFPEAEVNAGNALMKLDRMEEALEAYSRAARARQNYAAAICGQGVALRNLGRFAEAMAALETAEALGSYDAIANKGCLHLTLGDYERGWEGYEARWVHGRSVAEAFGTRFPPWPGPSGRPERVLVFNDHGLGDTIQFARYLPLMKAAGAEPTFVCPAKLWRLLSPSIPARFVEAPPAERFDAQIALSSLPRAFGTRVGTIPAAAPYLHAEPALVERWAARIGSADSRSASSGREAPTRRSTAPAPFRSPRSRRWRRSRASGSSRCKKALARRSSTPCPTA